ncbi:MAG: hydrogenase maturation factor [uncultured bacterium]|nr:MAG: hydrogenase maturation factor [uncultured bacterium]
MCLAVPGKIVRIDRKEKKAVVSFNGVKKSVNIELVKNLKKGNWVTVHTGFAIGKLNEKEARGILKLIGII